MWQPTTRLRVLSPRPVPANVELQPRFAVAMEVAVQGVDLERDGGRLIEARLGTYPVQTTQARGHNSTEATTVSDIPSNI